MSNVQNKFTDPAGNYTGGYTSVTLKPTSSSHMSNQTRGVIQVDLVSGTVDLQMRLHLDAPWLTVKTYSVSTIEEIVIANLMQVVATADATCWLGETQ